MHFDMNFTYESYINLVELLKNNKYRFVHYSNYTDAEKPVIMRHDVDESIEKAVQMAELEAELGISTDYFILLTSDLYNAASRASVEGMRRIIYAGHKIGLHFDETAYTDVYAVPDKVSEKIKMETEILSRLLDVEVDTFSFHRPSRKILEAELEIPGLINSYEDTFFHKFKYISDSRRRWRESVTEMICNGQNPRLNILTHAFWYNRKEKTLDESIKSFVYSGNSDRYRSLKENISDLESIMTEEDVKA